MKVKNIKILNKWKNQFLEIISTFFSYTGQFRPGDEEYPIRLFLLLS